MHLIFNWNPFCKLFDKMRIWILTYEKIVITFENLRNSCVNMDLFRIRRQHNYVMKYQKLHQLFVNVKYGKKILILVDCDLKLFSAQYNPVSLVLTLFIFTMIETHVITTYQQSLSCWHISTCFFGLVAMVVRDWCLNCWASWTAPFEVLWLIFHSHFHIVDNVISVVHIRAWPRRWPFTIWKS